MSVLEGLSELVFLDRYALKDVSSKSLGEGDTVVVVVEDDPVFPRREVCEVVEVEGDEVVIRLRATGETMRVESSRVDKPLELEPREMWERVAEAVSQVEEPGTRERVRTEFVEALTDFKFVPGGRILTGAGTEHDKTLNNCYVIPSPKDSRQGILNTGSDMVEIMARGGGVGITLSSLRPRTSRVFGVNGRSNGSVAWGELYSELTLLVNQDGGRRGALMLTLNDWHPDLLEFIRDKRVPGRKEGCNMSVLVSDDFMQAVRDDGDWRFVFPDYETTGMETYDREWDGNLRAWMDRGHPVKTYETVRARDVWSEIIESAWKSAEPGVIFIDRTNAMANSWYYTQIIGSNPCLTGDMRLLTPDGYVRFDELDEYVDILNKDGDTVLGRVWEVGVKDVVKLTLSSGRVIRCTPNHVFMTTDGLETRADESKGRKLMPNLRAMSKVDTEYVEYGHKMALREEVPSNYREWGSGQKRGFLRGCLSAKGAVVGTDKIVVGTLDWEYADTVKKALRELGMNAFVTGRTIRAEEAGERKEDVGRKRYEVTVSDYESLLTLAETIGFEFSHQTDDLRRLLLQRAPVVVGVEPVGREMVYDFNEPSQNWGIVEGVVTHNCGEQMLPANGVCCLGSVNLSAFVDWERVDWEGLAKTVRTAVRFLDNVVSTTTHVHDEIGEWQESERRLGLGTMGLGEVLIKRGLRYGSPESLEFIDKLYEFIAVEAYRASSDLAVEKGSFGRFDAEKFLDSGFMRQMPDEICEMVRTQGIRNVTLLTQAPTGSIGTMVGTSTGIEPFFSWEYWRKGRFGEFREEVRVVREWRERNPGQSLPEYFVHAMELTPEEHMRVQATVQKWVDASISKTVNAPNEFTVEETREAYEQAYDLGCKGMTVYRDGSREVQVLNLEPTKSAGAGDEVGSGAEQGAHCELVATPQGMVRTCSM